MKFNGYISTPTNTETHQKYIDYDPPGGWEKRARKLRDRRWRKLANRLSRDDSQVHFKPRYF